MRTNKQPYTQPLSILIIDDSSSERILLGTILRKQGHAVTEAAIGIQALRLLLINQKYLILFFWMFVCRHRWL